MVGDMLAALILASSATPQCRRVIGALSRRGGGTVGCNGSWMLGPPWNVSTLLFSHAVLMVMLAQRQFSVALVGQILMGTTFVLVEQATAELLVLYSRGSHALYRRLISISYGLFCVAMIVNGYAAVAVYTHVDKTAAFYMAAFAAATLSVVFGAYFIARLRRTKSGLRGGLHAAEDELLRPRLGPA